MESQTTFYVLGSIYMALGIVVMIALLVGMFFAYKKVTEIHKAVTERVEEEMNELKHKPQLLARYLSHIVAKGISSKLRTSV